MTYQRITGVMMLVAGVALLIIGVTASDSMADQMSRFFTGRFTETTVWYLVGGTVLAVGGLSLTLLGGGRPARA